MSVPGKSLFSLCVFLCALAAPAHQAPCQTLRGLRYEDPKVGFRFRIPRDYEQIPLQEDERWTVALFQSTKQFTGSVKDGDSGYPHKPMLKVILFDDEAIAKSGSIELGGGATLEVGRPYRDYKDYARINLTSGGYYFEQEEETTLGGVPVTQYEIKVDKNTRDRMRYIGWVFHGDGYDIALEVDVLEDQYRKLRNTIFGSFRTLEFIPREETEGNANATSGGKEESRPWDEMTAKERMDWRMAQDDKREARLRAKLPGDWEVEKTDNLLVMSHAGRSYTRTIITMAEACREYMDERFGSISDEYVRRIAIRICRDYEEYRAYVLGGSVDSFLVFAFGDGEITDYAEYGASFPMIFDGVFWHYISEKYGAAYFDIPYWLRSALTMYVRTAQLKGRRIVFDAPAEEGNAYSQLLHENRDGILSPRELMQLTSRDHTTDSQRELKLGQQFTLFLRYLEGPGQRHPLLKDRDFILEYLGHVSRITEEFEENNPIKVTPIAEATTEEEEARLAQQRTQRSQEYSQKAEARQKELLAKVIEAACPWTVEEWESLTKDYDRFARSR